MPTWIYDEKFLTGIQFLSKMLTFTTVEDDDLELPTQEQKERRTSAIGFELHRGLKNSATTFQALSSRYDKSNQRSSATTYRDSIDDYLIIRVSP
jgi:hypothetical protein